ncbi:MAG: restriction endonuclease subunit S [Paludibacteraceae bacterium]|nr:restriction endonuclease subunit S [Paludibacteraceae bacterium]
MNNKNQHIPQGYKNSPLGIIPEDWEVKRLGDFGSFKNGLNFTSNEEGFSYYFLGVGDFQDKTDVYANELGQIRLAKEIDKDYHLKDDDLVFVRSNGSKMLVGRCVVVHADQVKATYSGFCIRFRPTSEDTSAQYVKHVIDAGYLRRFLQYEGRGTNITNLNQEILGRLPFPLPTCKEQQNILNLLSLWDTAISKQTALIDKLTLRKRVLMQQLLTGKKRLKGFEGKWKKCAYSSVLKEIKRTLVWNEDELYKLISVRRRSEGLFFRGSLYGREIATKNLRPAKTGDFLISKMQIVHGASGLVTETFDNAKISGSYIALVAKDDNVLDMEYFNLWSQTPIFYHQTFISSFGVHIEKMTFDLDTFMSFGLSLPSINEQRAIVSVMKSTNKEIELAKQKLSSLQEQKKGLMQVLLTGKKRIK